MAETLVGKARRGQELEALDLAKVGALAEGEEVEELSNIVAPRPAVSIVFLSPPTAVSV